MTFFRFFTDFGRSPKWRTVRAEHLKIQPCCQACGSTQDLEVHHIEPYQVNPGRELDPTNLITLCAKRCHLMFGHLMDYKSWNVNVIEDCTAYRLKVQGRPYHESYSQPVPTGNPFVWIARWLGWYDPS